MNNFIKTLLFSLFFSIPALMPIPVQAQMPEAIAAPAPAAAGSPAPQPATAAPQQDTADDDSVTPPQQQFQEEKARGYNYANNEAEYSIVLPEAPDVTTIWHESPVTKAYTGGAAYTDNAMLGEIATYNRMDMDTEEEFKVKIIFIKVRKSFLQGLNKQKIQDMLVDKFKDTPLEHPSFTYSEGSSTLKWATLTGFSFDEHHDPVFNAIHYLTGMQSITVVEVSYNVDNKTFAADYSKLVGSIKYCAY